MIKIGTSKDLTRSKLEVPAEVQLEIQQTINLLDDSYGETRDVDKDLGGYALIIVEEEDINECNKLGITFDDTFIPEYVLLIEAEEGEAYTQSLFLANDDYAIITFIPLHLAPQYLVNMLEE